MSGEPIKIIVGLGNPGAEHQVTRHNAGFWLVDLLARRAGAEFRDYRKFSGETARIVIAQREVTLLKPTTYMNRSGIAVRQLMDYFKIESCDVLIAHDELDLPVGTVRLKRGGGHGGHNGLRDCITHIGDHFWRIRLGIGHPGKKGEVLDYVLSRAPREQETALFDCVAEAADAVMAMAEQGSERAMTLLHTRTAKV